LVINFGELQNVNLIYITIFFLHGPITLKMHNVNVNLFEAPKFPLGLENNYTYIIRGL